MEVRAATYGVGLEALHEDAVQERDDGLDRLEGSLSGLGRMSAWLQCGRYAWASALGNGRRRASEATERCL